MAEIGYEKTLNINQVAIYRAGSSDLLRKTVPVSSAAQSGDVVSLTSAPCELIIKRFKESS